MALAQAAFGVLRQALGVRPALPSSLILFVTARCNMRCAHCTPRNLECDGDELTADEIRKLGACIGPLNDVSLSGGEPFIRRDLDEIAAAFEVGALFIPTNGWSTAPTVEMTRRILASTQTRLNIQVSLDGFEATHDEIRGVTGAYRRATETALALNALADPRLAVTFSATISERNCRELPDLARHVRDELGLTLGFGLLHSGSRDPAMALPERAEIHRAVAGIEDASPPLNNRLHEAFRTAATQLRIKTALEGRMAIRCVGGSAIGVVHANGDVSPCGVLPPIGNIREHSFAEIWGGPAAVTAYREIRRGTCAKTCANDCLLHQSTLRSLAVPVGAVKRQLRAS